MPSGIATDGIERKGSQVLMTAERMYIDGEFTESSDGATISVENPATEEHYSTAPAATPVDVDRAVRPLTAARGHA